MRTIRIDLLLKDDVDPSDPRVNGRAIHVSTSPDGLVEDWIVVIKTWLAAMPVVSTNIACHELSHCLGERHHPKGHMCGMVPRGGTIFGTWKPHYAVKRAQGRALLSRGSLILNIP